MTAQYVGSWFEGRAGAFTADESRRPMHRQSWKVGLRRRSEATGRHRQKAESGASRSRREGGAGEYNTGWESKVGSKAVPEGRQATRVVGWSEGGAEGLASRCKSKVDHKVGPDARRQRKLEIGRRRCRRYDRRPRPEVAPEGGAAGSFADESRGLVPAQHRRMQSSVGLRVLHDEAPEIVRSLALSFFPSVLRCERPRSHCATCAE